MAYWIAKAILKPLFRALYRIRVEGLENVPRRGPVIIASNHVSFLDSFFIPIVIPRRRVTYLAKRDYFDDWKMAWFLRMVGQIPIERTGGSASGAALHTGLEVLKSGGILAIYPEGTRSSDGRLHRGKTGVARLASGSGAPVIPCGVTGSERVMPKSARVPRIWGRMEVVVRFGPAIKLERPSRSPEMSRIDARRATDGIMARIRELSGQEYVDDYQALDAAR